MMDYLCCELISRVSQKYTAQDLEMTLMNVLFGGNGGVAKSCFFYFTHIFLKLKLYVCRINMIFIQMLQFSLSFFFLPVNR